MNSEQIDDNFDLEVVAKAALTGAMDKIQHKYLSAVGVEITANIADRIEAISERQVEKIWQFILYTMTE